MLIAHMPSFPASYVNLQLPLKEREAVLKQQYAALDVVLEFFANLSIPDFKPIDRARVSCCCRFNNRICELIGYIASRPVQILRDAFRCCLKSKPTHHQCDPSELKELNPPREIEEKLGKSREDYHTNIVGLGFVAPAMTVAAPFLSRPEIANAFPAIVELAPILSGLTILTTAGIMTYFFSGNFGTDRVEATVWLSRDFQNLSTHLENKFARANSVQKKALITQCKKIVGNWPIIYHALEKVGLPEKSIQIILGPFSVAIHQIQMDPLALQQHDEENPFEV